VKVFLDSSKVSEVMRWRTVIEGVTTNPSILLKEGGDVVALAKELNPLPVSIEAVGDFETDARKYAKISSNVAVKIPLLRPDKGDNLELIWKLAKEGIPINCTALLSLSQVILATKAGARYVSLFAGRIDDEGGDYASMIADCIDFLEAEWRESETASTELIVGSIRTVGNFLDAVRAGADIVTVPPAILEKALVHARSRETVGEFEEAAREWSTRSLGGRNGK
jgi:transaldolase